MKKPTLIKKQSSLTSSSFDLSQHLGPSPGNFYVSQSLRRSAFSLGLKILTSLLAAATLLTTAVMVLYTAAKLLVNYHYYYLL